HVRCLFWLARRPPRSTLFPSTTLFRSSRSGGRGAGLQVLGRDGEGAGAVDPARGVRGAGGRAGRAARGGAAPGGEPRRTASGRPDRKSTRLNSSHVKISYAVFCLKKNT